MDERRVKAARANIVDGSANAEPNGASNDRMQLNGAVTYLPPSLTAAVDAPSASASDAGHRWVLRLMRCDGPAILRMLWRILGREQDVLDAYQDCFCKLASRGNGCDLANARAYAFRTAANIAIEMLRVRRRRAAHWPAVSAERGQQECAEWQDGNADSPDRLNDLREAIARLPAHLRNVIILRDLCRLAYEEVAGTLGIEPTTARVYRRHAVVKLAELMNERDGS